MKFRELKPSEYGLLKDFLYEAIYVPEGLESPDRSIIELPELARIGTRLLQEMMILLKKQGYKRVSLSVQKANYAVGMYRHTGFTVVEEKADEYIMVCEPS